MTSDQLQLQTTGGAPLVSFTAIGTLPGVEILAVAGACNPGVGLLDCDPTGKLTWTPPGGAAGPAVDVSAGGNFLLYDAIGYRWLSVHVEAAYLARAAQTTVTLQDVYDGPLVNRDATAAEAAAGNALNWQVQVKNLSGTDTAGSLAVGLPSGYSGLKVSTDNVNWYARGLVVATIASLAPGATATIYLQRTIAASSPPLAAGLVELIISWTTPAGGMTAARGLFRIFNPACYGIYCESTPPVQGSTPTFMSTSLPASHGTFADGTWYVSVSYFDGVYDSGFLPVGPAGETYQKIVVSGGSGQTAPPAPLTLDLEETAPGVVTVTAIAAGPAAGWQWQLTWSDPSIGGGAPTVGYLPMGGGAMSVLSYALSIGAPGTVLTVSVALFNGGGLGAGPALTETITLAAGSGPSAPLGAIAAEPITT
jgi:hypothetical protein